MVFGVSFGVVDEVVVVVWSGVGCGGCCDA